MHDHPDMTPHDLTAELTLAYRFQASLFMTHIQLKGLGALMFFLFLYCYAIETVDKFYRVLQL